jgi:hypothetical protein
LRQHDKTLRIAALALVVVAALAALGFYFQTSRAREAHEALGEALKIYEAPVAGEPRPIRTRRRPSLIRLPRRSTRRRRPLSTASSAAIPPRPPASAPKYFAALCRIQLGQYDAAETTLNEVAAVKSGDTLAPALAQARPGGSAADGEGPSTRRSRPIGRSRRTRPFRCRATMP